MPGLFGIQTPVVVALAVVALLTVSALSSPSGRRAVRAAAGSVARWPGLIRAELRGGAPLLVDGAEPGHEAHRPSTGDTTPDIPVVTRGLPVVRRPDRV